MASTLVEAQPGRPDQVFQVNLKGEFYFVSESDLPTFYKTHLLVDRNGRLTGWAQDHMTVSPVEPQLQDGKTTFRTGTS